MEGEILPPTKLTVQVSPTLAALIKIEFKTLPPNVPPHVRLAFRDIAYQLGQDTAADIPLSAIALIAPYLGVVVE